MTLMRSTGAIETDALVEPRQRGRTKPHSLWRRRQKAPFELKRAHFTVTVTVYGSISQMRKDVLRGYKVGGCDTPNSFLVTLQLKHLLQKTSLPSKQNDGNDESCFLLFLLLFLHKTHMRCLSRKPPDGIHLFSLCHFTINDSQLIPPRPQGPGAFSEPPSPHPYSGGNKEAEFYFHFHLISFCACNTRCRRSVSLPEMQATH